MHLSERMDTLANRMDVLTERIDASVQALISQDQKLSGNIDALGKLVGHLGISFREQLNDLKYTVIVNKEQLARP